MPATTRLARSFAFASAIAIAFAFAGLLTACPPFPIWDDDCLEFGCVNTTSPGSTGETPLPTTTYGGGGFQTVTGSEETPSTGAALPETGTGSTTTTGEPVLPPEIVEFKLTPETIVANGPIEVIVSADHSDGVRILLDVEDAEEYELTPGPPGVYTGTIDVLSGADNGEHWARLTPWRDGAIGAEEKAHYTIDLPEPGEQIFWETSEDLGPGRVAALDVLPDGQVVEFGTHFPNGAPRCYLRRRDKTGAVNGVAFILKDSECNAIDLEIDEKGEMFILLDRTGNDGARWWYGRISAWGLGAVNFGGGNKGEKAVALAHHPSGLVAVCGSVPTPFGDVDAMVQLFQPNMADGALLKFDYQPKDMPPHQFREGTQDCVFVGDTLALVGEMYGQHGLDKIERDRLFILRRDTWGQSAWMVAPEGVRKQSGARAVDVDDQGRIVVAGYTCDDDCLPEGDLRLYDAANMLKWQVSLGAFESKEFTTHDLAWSPAGYAVVATGGLKGDEGAFTVRAFATTQVPPKWTYTHSDNKALNLALALAIGRYGEVYAGGMGATGKPVVVYIGG